MKAISIFFWLVVFCASAQAGNIYVDRDASCPGSGTTGSPYCAIQSGVDAAVAGDHVRIRDSAGAYTGSVVTVNSHSGSAGNPIVVEPDVGHNPNILQRMEFYDSSHWTIQNLRHDACSTTSVSAYAIYFEASTVNVSGVTIQGNTISCWGGTSFAGTNGGGRTGVAAIGIRSNYTAPFTDLTGLIDRNTLSGGIESEINITGAGAPSGATLVVSNNDISGTRCGTSSGYRNTIGISIGGASSSHFNRVQIVNNHIHDLQSSANCVATVNSASLPNFVNGGPIYCDAGHYGDLVTGNLIHGLSWADSGAFTNRGVGIFWENGCSNSTISYNVIYDIDGGSSSSGIQLAGNSSCNDSHDLMVHNNTIYNVNNGAGALAFWNFTKNATIKNNIIVGASGARLIYISPNSIVCGGNVIDFNHYYAVGGGTRSWNWNGGETTSFTTWKSSCNCDANALNSDPQFISAGTGSLGLTASSPAIDAGTTTISGSLTACKNGANPDIGALETFGVASAEVGSIDASTITINFENNCGPPLLPASSITGFTARKAGASDTVTAAVRNGQNQIRLTVSSAYIAGNSCDFSYSTSTGNVTDSSLRGNTYDQRLNALTNVTCTNNVSGTSFSFETVDVRACSFFSAQACSSWISALNGPVTIRLKGKFILRFGIKCNTADCPASGFAPWISKNGGSYAQMLAISDASCPNTLCIDDAPAISNDATTQQITSGTFVAGKCVETGNAVPSVDLNTSQVTEICYPLTIGASVLTTDSFTIRMRRDDQSQITNTSDALITVVAAAMM